MEDILEADDINEDGEAIVRLAKIELEIGVLIEDVVTPRMVGVFVGGIERGGGRRIDALIREVESDCDG